MWLRWLCIVFLLRLNGAYKPVILIHGFMADSGSFSVLEAAIKHAHPGTNVVALNTFPNYFSMNPLWHQVNSMKTEVQKIAHSSPEGIHVIGFSQGGILARGIIEVLDDHNVDTFISLAAPHMGMYGGSYLKSVPVMANVLLQNAHMFLYTPFGQFFSFAGYWRDPYRLSRYRKGCLYLPILNNEVNHTSRLAYKNNFIKLKKLVVRGGPADNAFYPWQSSLFGFYKEKSNVIEDMKDQEIYKYDTFGLKTLDERGAVDMAAIPKIPHIGFVTDKNVIDNHILPYLT